MSSSARRFRIGSFTWFLMILLLVAAYYLLIDDMRIFYIVAGITILIMLFLMFFTKIEHFRGTSRLDNKIESYHANKMKRREESSVRFCDKCKMKIDKDSTFCSHCGTEVK